MSNINQLFLAGTLKHPTFYAPGEKTRQGRVIKYPMMSAMLQLPNITYWSYREGREVTIARQELWFDITAPRSRGELDVSAGRNWKASVQAGYVYATLAGATFTNDKNKKGRLRVSFGNLKVANRPPENRSLNTAIISGKAYVHDAHRLTVEERYANPREKDPKKRWKSRYIPVASPKPLASLHQRDVLVFGALSARDLAGNEYLHIIAEDVR